MLSNYGDVLTTEEVAQILKLNEKTVLKLVKKGTIPAMKIANQFRYSKNKLIEWIESEINLNKNDSDLLSKEILLHSEYDDQLLINHFLKPEQIIINLNAANSLEIIEELIDRADQKALLKNKRKLIDSTIMRETSLSTAIGDNFAFPHPRICTLDMVHKGFLIVGKSPQGIQFDQNSDKLTRIFILFAIPDLKLHLHLMSYMINLLKDQKINQELLAEQKTQKLFHLLIKPSQ